MDFISAHDGYYSSPDNTAITLTFTTSDFGDTTYTVTAWDMDQFAIDIYIRAISGDFGVIQPFHEQE